MSLHMLYRKLEKNEWTEERSDGSGKLAEMVSLLQTQPVATVKARSPTADNNV